jgi:2-C-methyl-D-erythritol 4-phosphate cytidylyltransferase
VAARAWAIVLAAGRADRFGSAKQFARIGGERLVDRVVRTASEACDHVVVVLPRGCRWDGPPVAAAVEGGASRAASVRAGLAAVGEDADVVVVCDAAHPLARAALFRAVVSAVERGAEAAVPGLPLAEVLKRVEDGRVVASLPRDGLVLAQTPQAFRAGAFRAAHASSPEVAEDSQLFGDCAVVPGDPLNLHVTTPAELAVAGRLLSYEGS